MISIEALPSSRFPEFAAYLAEHLSDNGNGVNGYFQPISRHESGLAPTRAEAFRNALETELDAAGWRRAWVARTEHGQIIGHIDLKGHGDASAMHRCILGMGVDRNFRKQGLGHALLQHATAWAQQRKGLEWIDLQVLSSNSAAIRLYRSAGFLDIGTVESMFLVDGLYLSQNLMALKLAPSGSAP